MSTYTRRLGAARPAAGTDLALFTATADATWIIRDVLLVNNSGAAGRSQCYISSGSSLFMLFDVELGHLQLLHLDLRQQLLTGEVLRWNCATTGFSVLVTGYALAPTPAAP